MPKLRRTECEDFLAKAQSKVAEAMTYRGWDREHTAKLVPWSVKQKYTKLNKFLRSIDGAGAINVRDLETLLLTLDLKLQIVERSEINDK